MAFKNKCRSVPRLSIRMFNKGAEPYFGPGSDFGYNWYSILQNEYKFGQVSYQAGVSTAGIADYAPTVEYIGTDRIRTGNRNTDHDVPIGLVLRPFIQPQDIGDWTTLAGDLGIWATRRCYQNPPVDMLVQNFQGVDDDGNTVIAPWGSQSDLAHPSDASFAFSILPAAVSPDYSEIVGGVPYYQFAWSGGKWAIRFFRHGNPVLLKAVGGVMIPLMELQSPGRISNGDDPDMVVGIVRVQRGALMISLDNGATYDVWWEPSGTAVYVPSGKYQFTGIGMAAAVGVHQVVYVNGHYDSPPLPMEKPRDGSPNLIQIRGNKPATTNYSIANLAPTLAATYMKYRLSLTKSIRVTGTWDYYYSPEVYIVEYAWPTTPSIYFPIHDGGATFEGRIQELTVDKPFELDESTCSWTARYTTEEGGPIGSFALRLVQVWGGWEYSDGTNDIDLLFTGYITNAAVTQKNSLRVDMKFTAQSTALRPKRMQWRDSNATPFDGLSVNNCLLKWAALMGLNSSFVALDSSGRGDNVVLPNVYPEQPAYVPTPGDPRWDIMAKIAELARLELGVLNNGSYALFPSDTFILTPYTWDADPPNDTYSHIETLSYEQRILDTFTGVLVRGKTMWNEQIAAWIYDIDAETNIFSSRFRPWPEWHIETIDHPVDAAWLGQAALGLAWNKITPNFEMTLKGELAHFVSRRHAVWVRNTTVGAGSLAQIGVLSMKHVFNREDPMMAWTEVRGRRL